MVTVHFPDRESERRALALLVGRCRARVLAPGVHWVPPEMLEELAANHIPFRVDHISERRMAAVRGSAAAPIQ